MTGLDCQGLGFFVERVYRFFSSWHLSNGTHSVFIFDPVSSIFSFLCQSYVKTEWFFLGLKLASHHLPSKQRLHGYLGGLW